MTLCVEEVALEGVDWEPAGEVPRLELESAVEGPAGLEVQLL